MNANSHGTAKRGEKRHWQYLVPLERGKLHGDRLRLNRGRRRLYNWKALSSSFSWVSFLGCLQQCSVLFIKATYSRETRRCGVQREERIVHTCALFCNWLHQNNALCSISLFNKNMDVNANSIAPVCHQYSAWQKSWTYCWNTGTVVTSRVGHVLSIQFGDNYVMCSEANYYYSWRFC